MSVPIKNIFISGAITPELIARSIQNHLSKKNIGGNSIFLGQVRADEKGDDIVEAIEYSTYEQMALEKAHQIREELYAKYNLSCMHIYHSIGKVKADEICLFVYTSSKHRKPAIEACTEAVERIKRELPVWGMEIISNNQSVWKENS